MFIVETHFRGFFLQKRKNFQIHFQTSTELLNEAFNEVFETVDCGLGADNRDAADRRPRDDDGSVRCPPSIPAGDNDCRGGGVTSTWTCLAGDVGFLDLRDSSTPGNERR
jgi:hypothetical protein